MGPQWTWIFIHSLNRADFTNYGVIYFHSKKTGIFTISEMNVKIAELVLNMLYNNSTIHIALCNRQLYMDRTEGWVQLYIVSFNCWCYRSFSLAQSWNFLPVCLINLQSVSMILLGFGYSIQKSAQGFVQHSALKQWGPAKLSTSAQKRHVYLKCLEIPRIPRQQ